MKQLAKGLLVFGFTSTVAVTTCFSQFSFDENGNATGPGTTPGYMSVEPFSGFLALTYTLPFGVAPGDLVAFEGSNTTVETDLIRFLGNQMWFFSEVETNGPFADAADVGIPPAMIPAWFVNETGPEGNNDFISDVPEPGTMALVGLGVMGLLVISRRKK